MGVVGSAALTPPALRPLAAGLIGDRFFWDIGIGEAAEVGQLRGQDPGTDGLTDRVLEGHAEVRDALKQGFLFHEGQDVYGPAPVTVTDVAGRKGSSPGWQTAVD